MVSSELLAAQGIDADLCTQERLAERQGQLHDQVVAVAGEDRVRRDVDGDVDVAAALGLAREADALAVGDAGRDLDRQALAAHLEMALGAAAGPPRG